MIAIRLMLKVEENGHSIEVKTSQEGGVWMLTFGSIRHHRAPAGLTDSTKLNDFDSEASAEAAGLKWARDRLFLYAEGALRGS